MSGFTGFTDADIRKVKNGQNPTQTPSQNGNRPKPSQKQKKIIIKDSRNHKYLNKLSPTDLLPIPEEAKLSEPLRTKPDTNLSTQEANMTNTLEINKQVKLLSSTDHKEVKPLEHNTVEINLVKNDHIEEKKFIDLDEFQAKQKMMEEQNRRRKELLAKALEDRTKRTLEEQHRLNAIQDEFKKLDATLSNDVKILRKQIELASVDYMEAQKRYHRIEREFLDAKLYLHQKLERKEMLTEYLCAIIEKNEERKAEKLNELLEKLNVTGDAVQYSEVSTSNDQ